MCIFSSRASEHFVNKMSLCDVNGSLHHFHTNLHNVSTCLTVKIAFHGCFFFYPKLISNNSCVSNARQFNLVCNSSNVWNLIWQVSEPDVFNETFGFFSPFSARPFVVEIQRKNKAVSHRARFIFLFLVLRTLKDKALL